jgi:hypothetical protein
MGYQNIAATLLNSNTLCVLSENSTFFAVKIRLNLLNPCYLCSINGTRMTRTKRIITDWKLFFGNCYLFFPSSIVHGQWSIVYGLLTNSLRLSNPFQSVLSVLSLPAPVYRQVEQAGVFY